MPALLTIELLSQYLHKPVQSIYNDLSKKPHKLPPPCRLPDTRRLLWRLEDVERWIAQHIEDRSKQADPIDPPLAHVKKRGRPTKAEQVARDRRFAGKTASHQSQQLKRA
jgi:predicted DNA-binding transcriptional regulator AlpA